MKNCTGVTLEERTNEMIPCIFPASYSAIEYVEEEDGNQHGEWRGDYCKIHAAFEQDAHKNWEFRII